MIKIEVTTYDTGAKCIAMLDPVYKDQGIILTECVGDGEFYHVTEGTVAEGETVEDPCCEQLVELYNDLYFRDYSEKSSDRPYTDYPLKGVLVETGNVVFLKSVDGGSSVGHCARCLLDEGLYTVDTDGTVTKVDD